MNQFKYNALKFSLSPLMAYSSLKVIFLEKKKIPL